MLTIQENVSLRPFNTFGLEATARFFVEVGSVDMLYQVLQLPDFQNVSKLFLGGGSNILLTQDFDGLVVKINIGGIELSKENHEQVWVKVGAGVVWHQLVMHCIAQNWSGIENLSLIPGTVGAAPMQNIGAYGVELKDVFEELTAIEIKTGELKTFNHADCLFGYRESIFKHEGKGHYVIVNVTMRLDKTPTFHTNYGDIQKTLAEMGVSTHSIRAVSEAVIKIRKSKLPDPAEIGNAGSFFKNPEIPQTQYDALKKIFPEIPGYIVSETAVKVPAGWLIEQAGWKGQRFGNIGVHARQALVLVNYGGGTGQEIKDLAFKILASVEEKFGIWLSPEVNFI